MTKAIRLHETGGADVLKVETTALGEPGPGEVLLRQTAIGVNYIDVYHRQGLYPIPIPGGLGSEAVGVVEIVGPGVTEFSVGDRVAYAGGPAGAYAQARILPASLLVKLPDDVAGRDAAALLLKGMTVEFLTQRCAPVGPGDTVLFHAAAGGVGLIACQWLKARGVTMIGTVSTQEKADLARANGCTHVINYKTENVVDRVRELTGGNGVPVVYDSVGADTWDISLDCLKPRGMLVSYGNTTGPVPPISLGSLAMKGSLYVTRPILGAYIASRAERDAAAGAVFDAIRTGQLNANIGQEFTLSDAAEAHRGLESGINLGSTILLP